MPNQYESPYVDDVSLPLGLIVYRAVNPTFVDWLALDTTGNPRMNSNVFGDYSAAKAAELGYPGPAMSVCTDDILTSENQPITRVLDRFDDNYGIAEFTVASLRSVTPPLGMCRDPKPQAPWHALVFATTRPRLDSEKAALRNMSRLVRLPRRLDGE